MKNNKKGFGYISVIVGILIAFTISSLSYKGLSNMFRIQKKTDLKMHYDLIIKNQIVNIYNSSWSELENRQIMHPLNDSKIDIEYEYKKGSLNQGVTDRLKVIFKPEDKRLNVKTYDLEKFPET